MFGISDYLMAGSLTIAVSAGGYGFLQKQNAEIARGELRATQIELQVRGGELATCGARLQNILDDVEDDNAIDNLTDFELRSVPDHWLHSNPGTPAPGD